MATVNKILVSSTDLVINRSRGSGKTLPDFKINQIVKARVIEVVSAREARLLLFGKKISAKTHAPLMQGEEILLKVSRAGMQPVFKLVEGAGESGAQTLFGRIKALGRSGPSGRLAVLFEWAEHPAGSNGEGGPVRFSGRIRGLLQETALKSGIPDPGVLSRFIQNSGLAWENKLGTLDFSNRIFLKDNFGNLKGQDLKALVMDTLAALKESDSELAGRLRFFVENLETLQLLNRQILEESGKYLLHFPALFGNRLKFGQMLIDLNRNRTDDKKKDNHLVRVAFLLELTHLGDMLAEFSILKEAVSGSFRVSDEQARLLIEENLPDLTERLTAHGFEVRHIECHAVRPDFLAGISLVDDLVDEDEGLLNLVV